MYTTSSTAVHVSGTFFHCIYFIVLNLYTSTVEYSVHHADDQWPLESRERQTGHQMASTISGEGSVHHDDDQWPLESRERQTGH